MAAQGHESTDRKTRLVVGTYLVLTAAPFIVAATTAAYWRHAEPATVTGLIAVVLILPFADTAGRGSCWSP